MYNIHDSIVYLYFFIILANKVACLVACLIVYNTFLLALRIRNHCAIRYAAWEQFTREFNKIRSFRRPLGIPKSFEDHHNFDIHT